MKFILSALLLLFSFALNAGQNGLVIVDRAIIYADVEMKHPIGYLGKWKSVRVGNIARNGGRVLPVTVSKNKIAYMNVKDLSFGRNVETIQAMFNRFNSDINSKKPKKDHFQITSNTFLGSADINDENFGTNSVNTYFYGFGFEYDIFYSASLSWYWSIAYEVSKAGDGVELTNAIGRLGGKYRFFRYRDLTFSLSANIGFSPFTNITTEYFSSNGLNFTQSSGLESYIPINNYMDFTIFAGYEVQKIIGLDLPAGLGEFNPLIIGFKTNLGLAIYY